MVFNSLFLVSRKRKHTIPCLPKIFFIMLCILVHSNQAGVIKKRDSTDDAGNSFSNRDLAPTQIVPTILNDLNNASIVVPSKIETDVNVKVSMRLFNKEMLKHEAKTLLEEEQKIFKNEPLSDTTSKKNEFAGTIANSKHELQNFKQTIQNLENNAVPKTTNEFNSNNLIEGKIPRLAENQIVNVVKEGLNHHENSSFLENALKVVDESPESPKKFFTELRTTTENATLRKKLENGIEIENENDAKTELSLDKKEKPFISLEKEQLNAVKLHPLNTRLNSSAMLDKQETISNSEINIFQEASSSYPITQSSSTSVDETKLKILNVEETKIEKKNITPISLSEANFVTTFNPTIINVKEENLSLFQGDEKKYGRSLDTEENDAFSSSNPNRVANFNPVAGIYNSLEKTAQETLKHEASNISQSDMLALNNKEKKPKFIHDNSTNAKKLNLPNNAEVWSLAAMKFLPKINATIETTQTYNESSKVFTENRLHNVSLTLSDNSEKNLFDWSQIMLDKELSTTARNGDYKNHDVLNIEKVKLDKVEDVENVINVTTLIPETNNEETIKKNSITTHELITSRMSSMTTSTVSSPLSYNENDNKYSNQPDKKVSENFSNHIEIFTSPLSTTFATYLENNPFSTSLNIETNLNKINLTLNQAHADINNEVHTIKSTEKISIGNDDDVAVGAHNETNSVTEAAINESTAVVGMTTLEQSSSETTTVSMYEIIKQYASVNDVVRNKEKQNYTINSINEKANVSLPISSKHDLENDAANKQNIDEIINSTAKTATAISITTFRPTTLTIKSTISTFEPEIYQNVNEIQKKFKNKKQQSISTTGLHKNHSTEANDTHIINKEFETNTIEPLTTATTTSITNLIDNKTENTLTTTDTSFSNIYEITNKNTELNSESSETTEPYVHGQQNSTGYEETTTVSSLLIDDDKFKKENTMKLLNETTETPVVSDNYDGKESVSTSTIRITTTTEENNMNNHKETIFSEEKYTKITATTKIINGTEEVKTATTKLPVVTTVKEETYISLLDDATTTAATTTKPTSTIATTSNTSDITMTTTLPSSTSTTIIPTAITTKIEEIYNVINSTTTELIHTTTQQLVTKDVKESSISTNTYYTENIEPARTTQSTHLAVTTHIGKSLPTLTSIIGGNSGNMYPKNSEATETDINVIIAITVSIIGVLALILLVGFLYLMRKRQKQTSYSQRCRPVSLDEYTIDNSSVGGSMRKTSALRASKRTYGNLAFDDPELRPNPMGVHELAKFVQEKLRIFEEFRDVPQVIARLDEVPIGCEDKNRYANVLPLPETRVILQRINDDEKSEYINANYVTGPKDSPNYYIACQAPLESTVEDFWRMIWEQQSRVIIQATDLIENGIEKCAEYLPPSATLDNHSTFGDFQITLQNRDVKDKYAISTVLIKCMRENVTRELTHYWYKWPEMGVPSEEAPLIAMLLEARSSLISYAIEQANEYKEKSLNSDGGESTLSTNKSTITPTNNSNGKSEINGNITVINIRKTARNQGPLTIHCSPGTGRSGTIIACDIAMRSLETPNRIVDIPQIVYYVRRGRASLVLTKEQYEFVYKVANMYAAKITNPTNYN